MSNKKTLKSQSQMEASLKKGKVILAETKSSSKKGKQTLEDDALKTWLGPLRDGHYSNEEFAENIHVHLDSDLFLSPITVQGNTGTVSPTESSFIYLDVGAWTGTRGKPWGNDPAYLKRDFGMVCGPVVLLCTYEYAEPDTSHCEAWVEQGIFSTKEPFVSLRKLISALSKPAHPSNPYEAELGAVIVREMMVAPSNNARWPESTNQYSIHVIVGDMHIPVLDDMMQTYGGKAEVSETHSPNKDTITVTTPDQVPRLGRLDIGITEILVKLLVESEEKGGAKALDDVIDFVRPFLEMSKAKQAAVATAIGAALTAGGGVVLSLGILSEVLLAAGVTLSPTFAKTAKKLTDMGIEKDGTGIEQDTMSRAHAEKWFQYYRRGADGGRPADIFENAGDHFLCFAERLGKYAQACQSDSDLIPAKFFQLGDMVDLWVGFTCHYTPSAKPDIPLSEIDPVGRRMMHHWTENLFSHTKQGAAIAGAVDALDKWNIPSRYLYGNHDNYLGSSERLRYTGPDSKIRVLKQRVATYQKLGIFMEHGHQWEGTNTDSATTLPVGDSVIGTPCPLGVFITQAAFIRPGPIRNFEGHAAGAMARFSGGAGQRIDQIVGSAFRFLEQSGGFYCYVMGHTHSACLSRVVVSTKGSDKLTVFLEKAGDNPETRVYIEDQGDDFEGKRFVPTALSPDPAKVTVGWTGMLGNKHQEWVHLIDPYAPKPGSFSKAIKNMALPASGQPDDELIFRNVPAGIYRADYYLARESAEPFRSSANRICVEGLSLEGDTETTEGEVYFFDEKKEQLTRPLMLRFAYQLLRPDLENAWFAIYQAKDPNDMVHYPTVRMALLANNESFLSTAQRPVFLMRNLVRYGKDNLYGPKKDIFLVHGRFDISRGFERMKQRQNGPTSLIGEFQLRAFTFDNELVKPLGMVRFSVKKASAHDKKKGH